MEALAAFDARNAETSAILVTPEIFEAAIAGRAADLWEAGGRAACALRPAQGAWIAMVRRDITADD